MAEELKIRIEDYQAVEAALVARGAKFVHELHAIDTYFKQPEGRVLKITEDDTGDYLVRLERQDGKFSIKQYERIADAASRKHVLAKELGVKRTLTKVRRFFRFGAYLININLIFGVGQFLVIEGEKVPETLITQDLGFKDPEFITVPFDELEQKK